MDAVSKSPRSGDPWVRFVKDCHFFWLLFFGQAKKSDPGAAGDRKLLLLL
jgi:hypothetical protein